MNELDLKDKKLLYEIDFDARKTYSELARILRMSKRGVEYKLENLEKKGIIKGYYPIINLSKLGYYYFRVLVKFQNLSKELKKKVENFIQQDKSIGWGIWAYNEYDLGFTIWAKSVLEFQKIARRFYFTFDKYIKDRRESIGTEIVFYKNRYLVGSSELKNFKIKEKIENPIKLDEIDSSLLKLLIKNPRAQIVDFAEEIGESSKVVSYRLKRLFKEEILFAVRPSIHHQQLGRTYYKVLINFNNTSEEKIKELEEYVTKNPLVIYIVKALGACDFDIELMTESNEQFFSFMEDLQTRFPEMIKEYKTLIFGDTIKARFLPFDV